MRYRRLDPVTGDYVFGQGQSDFFVNQPEAVAQYVYTRLMLWQGQWFYDTTQGTPWQTDVLGERTRFTRDVVVHDTVLNTPGVADIVSYNSVINRDTRTFTAGMRIDTVYGQVQFVGGPLPATVPPAPPPVVAVGEGKLLGIAGELAPQTPVGMERADLRKPGRQDITQFTIQQVDAGRF